MGSRCVGLIVLMDYRRVVRKLAIKWVIVLVV